MAALLPSLFFFPLLHSKEGSSFVLKKKKTTTAATFFDGFAARKWRRPPSFCGFATKKVMAARLPLW